MKQFINLESGEIYFGNQEFIGLKSTFDQVKKMNGTIDHSFENLEMGIQNLSFFDKEIEGNFYQISLHFSFRKLRMICVNFRDGQQLLETELWQNLKQLKTNKHTKKGDVSKAKKFDWGKFQAFYTAKINFGQYHISYK